MAGKKIKLVPIGEEKETQQTGREAAQSAGTKNRIKLVSDGTRDWENSGTKAKPVVTEARKQEAENLYQKYVRQAQEKTKAPTLTQGKFSGNRETTKGQSNEPNWGKIAGGTFLQGMDQFAQGGAATLAAAEQLVTKPLGLILGNDELYKDGLFYTWNEKIKEEQQQTADYFAPEYEKAGKAGEIIQKFGPSTVAAVPQAALAFFTAGQSLAAQGTTAALKGASAAAKGAGIAQAASSAMQQAAKNPQFWASFVTTAGNEYEQAKEDGADDLKAYTYGAITALLNSVVEVGGGIDVLPDGTKSAVKDWVEAMIDEGKEEVIQGAISQLSQAALYGKNNPLYSMTDQNAVINPARAAEEFLGGAVVGGILGGGQIAVQRTLNALGEAGARGNAQVEVRAQRKNQAADITEETGRLELTMPEELVQPGDYQMVQARQETVTEQVRQRIENEGGTINNAENDAGGIGNNGQSQLDPGGQTTGVSGAAGTAQSGRGQGYRARDLGAALDAANAPLISAREFFGDTNLSEDSYVREVPQDLIDTDEGLRTVAQKIRDTGYTPRLYSGNVRQAGGNLQVNGMISDTDVFIRADSVRYTPEQIWDHEMYHIAADRDPAIVKQAAAKLMRDFGPDIPNQVLARYIEAYKGVYTGRDLTMAAMEEMLADAYAGKDTFRQEVGRFTDTVREITPQTTQETNTARGPPRYTFGGTNAAQADLQALERAQTMEQQGVDAETIRKDTGWFRGADQKWRFEIDDSEMRYERRGDLGFRERNPDYDRYRELTGKGEDYMLGRSSEMLTDAEMAELQELGNIYRTAFREEGKIDENALRTTRLADYLQHEELFSQYPRLRGADLVFDTLEDGTKGQYDRTTNTITLDESLRRAPEDTLVHEIQHAIQQEENFAGGSSPEYWQEKRKDIVDTMSAARQNLELWLNDIGYQEVVKNSMLKVARNEKSLEQHWEDMKNFKESSQYAEQIAKSEAELAEYQRQYDEITMGMTPTEQYQNTAGEIEARDAAARRTMTEEQRRETAPNTGDENTVFADLEDRIKSLDMEYGQSTEEMPSTEGIDVQEGIRRAAAMEPVAKITGEEFKKGDTDLVTQVENFFAKQGNRAYNQQLGEIILDRRGAKSDISHGIGRKKAATFAAVADVIEKGQVVDYQKNWKGRGYDTAVIAAPITIAGDPYLMGVVVVKSSLSNRFYLHEVLTEKDGAAPFKTGTRKNSGDPGGDTPSIISILETIRNVKRAAGQDAHMNRPGNIRYSAEEDNQGQKLTEEQAEFFRESKVRDEDGQLMVMYHGTDAEFTVFDSSKSRANMDIQGNFFSPWELDASGYGQNVGAYYLNIKNPANETTAYRALRKFQGQNEAGRKAREYLEQMGYDGVDNSGEEYIAFYPEQIKRADNKTPTKNPDIRYSAEAETETDTRPDMEAETLRKLADLMPGVKRRDLQAIMSDIKGGAIEAQLMADFWDQYDNIRVADYTAEAQELQEVKRALQGRKIYADENLKAEFGDDWNDIRKKAFGKRLYFTSNRGDGISGLDQINQELAGQFPQLFDEADTDPAAIMDNILTVLERSGESTISLDEEAARYGGSEAVADFRQSYVNRFLDIAREYRDYLDGMEESKRAERKAARDAERKRLDDYITQAREILRKRYIEGDYSVPALALRSIDQETGKAVDIDDYVRRKEQEAREKKEERLRHIPKENFKGSKNLERLGVKIDGTVTDYFGAEGLRANDQAMRSIKKELRAAEKRLRATAKEKSFASKIVSGELTEADIPATVNRDKVMELADYYMAERAAGTGMIQQQRQDINRLLDERMKELFKDAPDKKLPGAITLNHRTPERVMLSAFGDKEGANMNKALIEPVRRNEAERIRFINRELDKVRTFQDSTGKESALTKEERAAVQQTIEGRAAEEIIAGMEMSEAIKRVGENLKAGENAMDLQLEFPLAENERKLAKQYARWLEAQEAMDNNKVDRVKVENAAKKYSELFDQYYEAINDFLVVHGYQPIGFIKGYAPHLQPQDVHSTLSNVMRSMGLLDDVSEIPTSIAGLTGDFRPGKKWNPFFLTRQTDNAQQDIATGFESYVQYLSDVLYHTDDIMRIRAAERYFRKTYAPTDIKAQLEQAEDLRWMPQEDKEAFLRENGVITPGDQLTGQQVHQILQDYIDQQYRTLEEKGKYSNLAPWLQNYANILAGKQTWADRSWESSVGRKGMNIANKVMRALTRSQVAGNISTVLNQTAQLPQIIADAGTVNTAQAMRDMIDGRLKRTGFTGESDFLTSKKGIEYLVNTPGEMVTSALFKPAAFMDEMISTLATRSGYLKAIKEGKSDADAMRYADSFAEKVMGSRAKGSRPLAFENKNILSQMVHLYQIEALNSWEHLTQDLPRDFREIERTQGKNKAAMALAGVIVKMLFSAFLLNRVAEETYGGTPAPYDLLGLTSNFIASGEGLTANQWLLQLIDNGTEKLGGERIFGTTQAEPQEFDWSAAADDAAYQIMGDLPLVRNVAGLLGVGDQTQVWSGLGDAVTNTGKAIAEDGAFSGRTAEELFLLAAQLMPGGNQARKTYQGAKALIQGGKVNGYGDNARMQYAVEQSPANIVKGLIFGQSAFPESREYYAGGAEGGLSAKQTEVVNELVEAGADNQEAFDVVQGIKEESGTLAKLRELAEAPWGDDIKEIAAESFMGESQFARYQEALAANVSTMEYSDFLTVAYENAKKRTGKVDASPAQEDIKNALNDSGLSRSQKRAIWNSYGWKTDSPW